MGKYKAYNPALVAATAWEELTKPETIDRMVRNYTDKIRGLPADRDAMLRYQIGVAAWTATMREYAPEISRVIANAKAEFLRRKGEALERARAGEPLEEIIRAITGVVVPRVERVAVPAE